MLKIVRNFIDRFKVVDISQKPVPCVSCGACCGYFQVGFKREKNQQVPWEKIVIHSNGKAYMKGAEKFKGKCESLSGEIGKECSCSIYNDRPDVCRLFPVWLPNGRQNPKCIKARENYGLIGKIEYK
jgi:Fe-S-cluster containining protein